VGLLRGGISRRGKRYGVSSVAADNPTPGGKREGGGGKLLLSIEGVKRRRKGEKRKFLLASFDGARSGERGKTRLCRR